MINVSGTAKFLGSAALTCLSVAFFLLSDTTSFSAYGETEKDNDPQTAHKKCIEDWGRFYAEFEHKCLVWGRDKTIVIEADCAAAGKRLKATKNEIDSLGDMKIITGMTSYGAGLDSESLASEQQQLDNKVKDAERRLK
ncbi:MAG TPA: hypothetical protein VN328_00040, partial [Thermodesulfovibrionales bacterium]|nr:hypothetical protein [Thermodesulfovibrionales bacterium]